MQCSRRAGERRKRASRAERSEESAQKRKRGKVKAEEEGWGVEEDREEPQRVLRRTVPPPLPRPPSPSPLSLSLFLSLPSTLNSSPSGFETLPGYHPPPLPLVLRPFAEWTRLRWSEEGEAEAWREYRSKKIWGSGGR
eukprot:77148-Rhodomonas_salina.1